MRSLSNFYLDCEFHLHQIQIILAIISGVFIHCVHPASFNENVCERLVTQKAGKGQMGKYRII